jgi:hypothetical protein
VPSRCELWSRLKNGNKSEPQQGQRWRTQCTCSRETLRKVMPLRAPQSKAVFKTQAGIDHDMSTISPSNPTYFNQLSKQTGVPPSVGTSWCVTIFKNLPIRNPSS